MARALGSPPARNTRRRRTATALLVALAMSLVLAPQALAGVFSPEDDSGSPNAVKIKALYWIALALGILIFLLVEVILIYSIVKFRRRRGGPEPAQIRGNTPLEVGWTIGAAALLVVLTIVTFIFLGPIKNPDASKAGGYVAEKAASGAGGGRLQFASLNQPSPPGPKNSHLTIDVNGQQYLWRYNYPNGVFSYYDMYVPVKTTVVLNITASDVDHSWWIPALGGKADAIPGHTNHTWFRIDKPGTWWGNCAEF